MASDTTGSAAAVSEETLLAGARMVETVVVERVLEDGPVAELLREADEALAAADQAMTSAARHGTNTDDLIAKIRRVRAETIV